MIAREGGQGIAFICSSCRFSLPYSPDHQNRSNQPVSQESVNQLFEMVKAVTITVGNLAEAVKQQGEKCVGSHSCKLDDNALYTKFSEFEDRTRRKDSIIVKGIQATDANHFSITFESITEKIIGEKLTPVRVHCIDQNKAIYRADIPNRELRIKLLQNAKKLKDDNQYKNIYINKDLTFQQRKEARERREDTRERRRATAQDQQRNLTGGNRAALGNRNFTPQERDRSASSSNSNNNRSTMSGDTTDAASAPNTAPPQAQAVAAAGPTVQRRTRSQSNSSSHAPGSGAGLEGGF